MAKKPAGGGKFPDDVKPVFDVISKMVDDFCREHLNEEYAILFRKLTEKLARKRPSPLVSGKPNTWACGIVRTIGWVNFLDDRSQTPHMKLPVIDKAFGVAESTGQGKSKLIRTMLKIRQFDHHWTLRSKMEDKRSSTSTKTWPLRLVPTRQLIASVADDLGFKPRSRV
jgi:hypothetical protein